MKKLLILSLVIFSCKSIEKKNDGFFEFKNDTIFSKGNEIVFFMPNKNFFKKNLLSFEGSEETDADFKHYSNEVYNDIKNKLNFPIKAKIAESRFLGIINFKNDTTFIDRYKDSLHYGVLLNFSNKKYQMEEGVFTDDDFWDNLLLPKDNIDFNFQPIVSKQITLNNEKYWVTSSLSGNKKLDTICKFEDYWLKRTYNVISKKQKTGRTARNEIVVFVRNDKYKWNGEKAKEVFKSIILTDNTIKVWNSLYVGMKKEDLVKLIDSEEYHTENKVIILYSKIYETKFQFNKNNMVSKIVVERRCND